MVRYRALRTDFRYPAAFAVLVSSAFLAGGCSAGMEPDASGASASPSSDPTAAATSSEFISSPAATSSEHISALMAAQELRVKGRAPKTGYARSQFGQAWADVDRNGCDTRNDILGRDLVEIVFKAGTRDCKVLSGTLFDPYSGDPIAFTQGADTSKAIQIDHVVALSDAWQKGAQNWSEATRVTFANDPLNLLAVSGLLNQQKGDGDAATWLPPNQAYRCAYVARQVAVKRLYGLWVTASEQEAMVRVLTACPDEPLPDGGYPQDDDAVAGSDAGDAIYFKNCTEAWAAGAAPIVAGEPGYGTHLDGDGDGIACETQPG